MRTPISHNGTVQFGLQPFRWSVESAVFAWLSFFSHIHSFPLSFSLSFSFAVTFAFDFVLALFRSVFLSFSLSLKLFLSLCREFEFEFAFQSQRFFSFSPGGSKIYGLGINQKGVTRSVLSSSFLLQQFFFGEKIKRHTFFAVIVDISRIQDLV